MATFGVSMPDDIQAEIDARVAAIRTDRSKFLVQVYLEWKDFRQQAAQGVAGNGQHLGTGPGDEALAGEGEAA